MAWSSPVPVGCRPTSNFGPRNGGLHAGDDYAPPKPGEQNIPFFAIGDGVVIGVGSGLLKGHSGKYNLLVQHPGDIISYYGHPNAMTFKEGDRVKGGQQLGVMGYNGNVIPEGPDGTHLHLGLIVNGRFVDPSAWLAKKNIIVGKTAPVNPRGSSTPVVPSKPKKDPKVVAWQRRQNYYAKAGLYVDGIKGTVSKNWERWVKDVQDALDNYNGVRGEVVEDGDYGRVFNNQVREVQRRNGLHQDGIIGPIMLKWMRRQGSSVADRPDTRA